MEERLVGSAGRAKRTVLGLSILFTLLNLPFLVRGRMVWQDEVEFSIVGYRLAFDGHFGSHFWGGAYGMDTHYYSYIPLYSLFLAGIYRVFGFGIVQTRIMDIALYGMCVGLTYELGRRMLGSRRGGFWSALLLGGNPLFIWAGRSARPEPMMLFFALAGCIAFDESLGRQEATPSPDDDSIRRPWSGAEGAGGAVRWMFLSGVLLALSACSHPIGLLFPVSVGAHLLWGIFKRRRPRSLMAALVGGTAISMIPWGCYIAQDPAGFVGQMQLHSRMGGGLRDVLTGLRIDDFLAMRGWRSLGLWTLTVCAAGHLAVGLMLLGDRVAWIKWRWPLFFLITGFVIASVVKPHAGVGTPYRFTGAAPFVAIGMAALGGSVRGRRHGLASKLWRATLPSLVVIGMLGGLGVRYVLWPALEGSRRDVEEFTRQVALHFTRGARVLGPSEIWYAVGEAGGRLQNISILDHVVSGVIPAGWVDLSRFDFVVTRAEPAGRNFDCGSSEPPLVQLCRLASRCPPLAEVSTGELGAGSTLGGSGGGSAYRVFIYRVDPACLE